MVCLCGIPVWCVCVACLCGVSVWHACVVSMCGVVCMRDVPVWCVCVACYLLDCFEFHLSECLHLQCQVTGVLHANVNQLYCITLDVKYVH